VEWRRKLDVYGIPQGRTMSPRQLFGILFLAAVGTTRAKTTPLQIAEVMKPHIQLHDFVA